MIKENLGFGYELIKDYENDVCWTELNGESIAGKYPLDLRVEFDKAIDYWCGYCEVEHSKGCKLFYLFKDVLCFYGRVSDNVANILNNIIEYGDITLEHFIEKIESAIDCETNLWDLSITDKIHLSVLAKELRITFNELNHYKLKYLIEVFNQDSVINHEYKW